MCITSLVPTLMSLTDSAGPLQSLAILVKPQSKATGFPNSNIQQNLAICWFTSLISTETNQQRLPVGCTSEQRLTERSCRRSGTSSSLKLDFVKLPMVSIQTPELKTFVDDVSCRLFLVIIPRKTELPEALKPAIPKNQGTIWNSYKMDQNNKVSDGCTKILCPLTDSSIVSRKTRTGLVTPKHVSN